MPPRSYRRFPKRQTCDECSSRRWYLQDGLRYCENGHQVEGYIQYDIDEDDNFGQIGKTIRKKSEKKAKEKKQLSGNEARKLYLECLQLLLRKQTVWLMKEKGFHRELESVCRDLWLMRVKDFPGLQKRKEGEEKGGQSAGGGGGDDGMAVFSSQDVEEEKNEDDSGVDKKRKSRSWSSEIWALPGVMDTLGIVYLACLLRGEPVRIGDVWGWARSNQMPFLAAIEYVPKDWRDRLPGWAHSSLLTRYARFKGSELHRSVMALMLGYKENHGMEFPTIRPAPLLWLYVRDLALPLELHPFTQRIYTLLGWQLSFPTRRVSHGRHILLDIPDVLLISSLIVATKLGCPFDDIRRYPRDYNDPLCVKMNWELWQAEFQKQSDKRLAIPDYEHTDPKAIWSMEKKDIVELLTWFQETRLKKRTTDETEIDRLFPLKDVPPLPRIEVISTEEIEARLTKIQKASRFVEPKPDHEIEGTEIKRLGSDLRLYKHVEELDEPAKKFYEVAAEMAGMSLRDLVKAVYTLDTNLLESQRKEKRRRIEEELGAMVIDEH